MLVIPAYAKINLTLDVLHKRDDGYHEVVMIMQSVDLADRVILSETGGNIAVAVNVPSLACDQTNLAYRAAALIKERFYIDQGVHIRIEKNIPLAAGLAGGSADAAAVLTGLSRLWGLDLSRHQLAELGAELGSDVPFCLHGGTMLATGRGEILQSLPDLPACHIVLAKPAVDVSTAWVYGHYQSAGGHRHPDTERMIHCIGRQDMPGIAAALCNVLESVTISAYPQIADIKAQMLAGGALNSLMSGSGPTVFGIAADARQALHIAEQLQSHSGDSVKVVVAKTMAGVE